MTPDWYEDLAERLLEAAEHGEAMGCEAAASSFRVAAANTLDMATSDQDELEVLWQEANGR